MQTQSLSSSQRDPERDEIIRQAIAESAQKQLEQLNPDYPIAWSEVNAIPNSDETIRFGDLPEEIQQGIIQGLESSARGESSRWEFT